MASREIDDEGKSYSAIFLVAVGLLLIGSIWSVWDDNILRRPWKKFQAQFFDIEQKKAEDDLRKEEERLQQDPKYVAAVAAYEAAKRDTESGETARKLAMLRGQLDGAKLHESEWDLKIRIVKSEIEAARYEYEHAVELGGKGEKEREFLDAKEAEKKDLDGHYAEAQAKREAVETEIKTLNAAVKQHEDELDEFHTERDKLQQKLEGLTINVPLGFATLRFLKIPKIEQVVLPEFDRNAYDQGVGRVDRCLSCHAGIDKPGFEDLANPHKTHPDRGVILTKHPTEKFGCTSCHEGQGPAVNSPAVAHGEVHFWERPLLRGEKVESSCISCHDEVHRLPHATRIAQGEQLFEQLGCHGCHLVEGYDGLSKVGPSLRNLAAKGKPEWMVSWIENPQRFRPRTKMPWFLLSREQATQVAAYVLSVSRTEADEWLADHPIPQGVDPGNAGLVAAGKELVDSVGCRGCHAFTPEELASPLSETKDIAPNLSRIGEKAEARWIYHWVKDPRAYNPTARMPNLRLSDAEAAAITSYLLTLKSEETPADAALVQELTKPENVEAGKTLVRKYGCFGCHEIPGMEKESRIGVELSLFGSKNLEEMFFADQKEIPRTWEDWTYHKIRDPRIYETEFIEQLMPNFHLKDEEIRSLRIFLASRVEHRVPPKYRFPDPDGRMAKLVAGRRLVEKYNCIGCHVIDERGGVVRRMYEDNPSFAPPILNGEGKKVQADWLFSFVKDPTAIRPWLKIRMPTFGLSDEEARTVVDYFAAIDGVKNPYVFVNEARIPAENLEAAKTLVSTDYFACFSCHQQGDKKPEGPPEGWAPDLGLARRRLNPEWILEWIHDPQKLMPGTKMPSFYPGGPDDVFGGSEAKQIEALRDYLMVLGKPEEATARRAQPTSATTGASAGSS